jgi:hypothetical protein
MKFKIYTIILILISIFTISINSIFGDSDFVLELKNVNMTTTISKLEIDGENVEEICPSSNCELKFTNSSFSPPKPNNMTIAHTIDFNLIFKIADADSVPIKKKSSEKFSESMKSCSIYDVIENKEQKIYFCDDGTNIMIRNSDFKVWYYESIGIYDVIKNTYTVKGDLIDNSTS